MRYYWMYFVAWYFAWYLFDHPALLIVLVALIVLRKFIPDPVVWAKTSRKIRRLNAQALANPSNATVRRDLARTYLDRRRPKKALKLLDEARERFPDDAELLYLTGVAKLRRGDFEGSLDAIEKTIAINPKAGFGHSYLIAGDALVKQKELERAESAYEEFLRFSSSDLEGWYKLFRVQRRQGNNERAKESLAELFNTWHQVPSYLRRKQRGWWLRGILWKLVP